MTKQWYIWTSANIAVWNKSKFPNITAARQRMKLAGEITEFNEAITPDHKLEELADVYIASAGLTRFGGNDAKIGSFICSVLESADEKGKLQYAVGQKMLINIERQFDKNMHHI